MTSLIVNSKIFGVFSSGFDLNLKQVNHAIKKRREKRTESKIFD